MRKGIVYKGEYEGGRKEGETLRGRDHKGEGKVPKFGSIWTLELIPKCGLTSRCIWPFYPSGSLCAATYPSEW